MEPAPVQDQTLFYAAIAAYGTWATVAVALFVLALQNKAAKRLTCLQIFNELASTYTSAEFNQRRSDLAAVLLKEPKPEFLDDTIPVFFEHLALMVKRKLLDHDLTYNIFGMDVVSYWTALHPYILSTRQELRDNSVYDQFEWLKTYFIRENLRRGLSDLGVNTDSNTVRHFLIMELHRSPKARSEIYSNEA